MTNTPQDGGDELHTPQGLARWLVEFEFHDPDNRHWSSVKLIDLYTARIEQLVQARVREAEKRAETRWKREHDYWKQLAETFLKRDQLRPPEPMYVCDNPVCSSLHTAEQLQQLTKPQADDEEKIAKEEWYMAPIVINLTQPTRRKPKADGKEKP